MAITPQAIKDQEFQSKFRGYDTVEVKAYLELIAEEFYELLEQVRQQFDELDVIVAERDALQDQKRALEKEVVKSKGNSEEIQTEYAERDSEIVDLRSDIESLKLSIETLKEKKKAATVRLATAEGRILKKEEAIDAEKLRNDKLTSRIDTLTKQNEELRKEEIDFKSTLVAAQQFTNEVKRKSENEAKAILEKARADVKKLRQDTFDELSRYPAEIERLKNKRNKVRGDLEALLKLCLENLEIFTEDEKEKDEDYGDLYQSIQLNSSDSGKTDDLDSISMEFDLPATGGTDTEERFSMKDEMENFGGDTT